MLEKWIMLVKKKRVSYYNVLVLLILLVNYHMSNILIGVKETQTH